MAVGRKHLVYGVDGLGVHESVQFVRRYADFVIPYGVGQPFFRALGVSFRVPNFNFDGNF